MLLIGARPSAQPVLSSHETQDWAALMSTRQPRNPVRRQFDGPRATWYDAVLN